MYSDFRIRLRSLFQRRAVEREMNDELREHYDRYLAKLSHSGFPREDAMRHARLAVGGPDQIKEEIRDAHGARFFENFAHDVRYALRLLRKSPGFTAIAVLTLALGIGANTAIFSVVHAVLLTSLPYRQPAELVKVWGAMKNEGIPQNWISEPEWWELRDNTSAFSELAAYSANGGMNLTRSDAEPERVTVGSATSTLFPLLGVQTPLGRAFNEAEDQPGRNRVALLGYALWKSKFAADPDVLNKTVFLNNTPYSVIGVLPAGFEFAGDNSLWIPLALDRNHPQDRGSHYLEVIARRKPGVNFSQVSSELDRFARQLAHDYPLYYAPSAGWTVFAVPLQDELVGAIRPALFVLLGAVVFVLLIACANIANLLLARACSREKEVTIRASMGASRFRIVRQLLTESVALALAGGAAGLLLGYWGLGAIQKLSVDTIPHNGPIRLDGAVLAFTFALSVLTGILFGLAPALHVAGANLNDTLKESGRGATVGAGGRRLRDALVITGTAFALLLLVGAGLMVRSFAKLLQVDPGFRSTHLLTLRVSPPQSSYVDATHRDAFYHQVLEKVRALPGVEAAGAISNLPMGGVYSSGSVFIEDSNASVLQRRPNIPYPYLEIDFRPVTPGYFEAMNVPLVSGRLFREGDNASGPRVAIVDTDFANHIWPGQNPIGKRIAFINVPNSNPPQPMWQTVVGLISHVRNYSVDVQGREQAYFPLEQVPFTRSMFLVLRSGVEPRSLSNAIGEQVRSVDKNIPVYLVRTMDDLLSASVAQPRLNLALLAIFAGLAVLLAAIGIYGVISYGVTQRMHELGIRMALGARPRDVMNMVLGQGMRLALIGIAAGLLFAFVLTRLMAAMIFGISTHDLGTFASVTLFLVFVAAVACWIPARRATRVNPMVALRHE